MQYVETLLRQISENASPIIIRFHLSNPARTRLTIFNLLGDPMRVVFDGEIPAGRHAMVWDGRGDDGLKVPCGIYFYRIEGENQFLNMKLFTLE